VGAPLLVSQTCPETDAEHRNGNRHHGKDLRGGLSGQPPRPFWGRPEDSSGLNRLHLFPVVRSRLVICRTSLPSAVGAWRTLPLRSLRWPWPWLGPVGHRQRLPAITSRATSASRRPEDRAARRSRSKAAWASRRSRPITIPLACSISHRCSNAACSTQGVPRWPRRPPADATGVQVPSPWRPSPWSCAPLPSQPAATSQG
jgi:hypothetical protein